MQPYYKQPTWLQVAGGALTMLLLGLLAACNREDQVTVPQPGIATGPTPAADVTPFMEFETRSGGNVMLSEITSNPNAYVNETVTVIGEIVQVNDSQPLLRLGERDTADANELLVLLDPEAVTPVDMNEGTTIHISGTVQRFNTVADEYAINADAIANVPQNIQEQPVIVAESVSTVTEVDAITNNLADYLGETVTVRGTLVEVLAPQVFRMEQPDGNGNDLLVVGSARSIENVTTSEEVLVQGEVRHFDLVAIEAILSTDLEERLFDNMEGKTTVIAQAIMPER